MRKIEVKTVYELVDDEFLDFYCEKVIPNVEFWDAFKRGEVVTYATKDPYGDHMATTTWQVLEEEQ